MFSVREIDVSRSPLRTRILKPLRCDGWPRHMAPSPLLFASPSVIQVDLFFRSPRHGVSDPSIDVGFSPAGAVDADPDLRRKRAFGDFAIDGGPGQARPDKDGVQADDTVWCGHGCAASYRLFLTAPDPERATASARARVYKASA